MAIQQYLFNGPEYVPARDNERLLSQLERIRELMLDHRWRTLMEIRLSTGDPEASISAQLRHLRKTRFGGYKISRRMRQRAGLYEYKLEAEEE